MSASGAVPTPSWGFVWRRIRGSLAPRPGAAPLVPFDRAALERSPSITWVGHSTFLVQMDGATFLTDPVWSERASPVPFFGPRRLVPPGVPLDALPRIDFALLSHDHYDHADRPTLRWLAARGVPFVVPLRLGEWVRRLGGTATDLGWWQEVRLGSLRIHCVPARHFSGRSLWDRNRRLWCGWVVSSEARRFYYAGDTAYSNEFAEIRERVGPVDLATVPIGAYLPAAMMRSVHTTPEEGLRIGVDIGAQRIVAMHYGTFDLADEPLDEPPQRFRAEAARLGLGPERAWTLSVGETRAW